ncbi:MAG TPA: hypothetical protein VGN49_07985 [Micrococcaceae bacterium]|nr:hypothetical protein [Micrococcaceae bacterium]
MPSGPATKQIANFITYGILTALSAFGSRASLVPGRAACAFPALKFLTGLALVATGTFHQGMMHNVVSYTSLIAAVTGLFVIARWLHQEPGWRGWASYGVISAVIQGIPRRFRQPDIPRGGGFLEKLATLTGVLLTICLPAGCFPELTVVDQMIDVVTARYLFYNLYNKRRERWEQ